MDSEELNESSVGFYFGMMTFKDVLYGPSYGSKVGFWCKGEVLVCGLLSSAYLWGWNFSETFNCLTAYDYCFFIFKMINNNSNALFNSNSLAGLVSRCLNETESWFSEMLYSMHSLSLFVNQVCLLLKRSCHVNSCRNNTVFLEFNYHIGDRRCYLKAGFRLDRNWLIYVVPMNRACQFCLTMFPQIVVALRKDISLSRVALGNLLEF
jgi:hypothetical protein